MIDVMKEFPEFMNKEFDKWDIQRKKDIQIARSIFIEYMESRLDHNL